MRFLKLAIGSLIILFLLTTAIGLFFPSAAKVTRVADIAASYDSVYHYLNDVKYWKLWMYGADTNIITFLSAKTAGTGTVAKIGTGQVTITRTTADSIYTIWKSQKGNIQNSAFVLHNNVTKHNITVQWFFEQKINWYPWERFGAMANDKILGPVMEQSLDKLKRVLEKSQ
ncbi:MAG TPA: hypothetical protein VH396_09915 [Chitinophagaceae bacterium]|jgi:hypothetical protein